MTQVQSFDFCGQTYNVGDRISRRMNWIDRFGHIAAIHVRDGILPYFDIVFDGDTAPISWFSPIEFTLLESSDNCNENN